MLITKGFPSSHPSHPERHIPQPQTQYSLGDREDISFGWSLLGSSPRIMEMAEEILSFLEDFYSLQGSPALCKATGVNQTILNKLDWRPGGDGGSIGLVSGATCLLAVLSSFLPQDLGKPAPTSLKEAAQNGCWPLQSLHIVTALVVLCHFTLFFICHASFYSLCPC